MPLGYILAFESLLRRIQDGVEFLREVRRRARLAELPIVLTTIEADGSELLGEAKRLGVAAVVKKPWHPQQLRDLVEAIVHPGE